ncbi:MAG: cellulase family glycosylhydrolase [Actinobacteria bacterium]|nr:cellulase family glycosylhydrolase [Actinomycetota bacterium]
MRRTIRLVLILSLVAAIAAPAAMAAERMWVGFHDDPSYRWVDDRLVRIERSARDGSTIVRLLVQWNLVAPERPANATNPFDPSYRLDDVDEAARAAQEMDQEVMITISGTPRWANGGQNANRMPRNLRDLTNFSRAMAARYSGRYNGFPYIRFWSVWNEPNLNLFLTPQFNSSGRSVAPANYAKLYAAAYAGIKAGNSTAQVAIGETSARGRDRRISGVSDTHSPGKFAELVARANPRLKFSAWAHHPYPSTPNLRPGQVVKWPNVSLTSLPRFQENLKKWFRQKNTQIWVTEYGHQTRPEDSLGVPYSTQSAYIKQSIDIARRYPFVGMFIWFVYQDDQGQPWESGLYRANGSAKNGSPGRFGASARPLDARNAVFAFRRGTVTPLVKLHTRRYCVGDTTGTAIGMTWRTYRGTRLLDVDQQTSRLQRDCAITARIRFPGGIKRGVTYTATFMLNDINGVVLNRRLTIRGI